MYGLIEQDVSDEWGLVEVKEEVVVPVTMSFISEAKISSDTNVDFNLPVGFSKYVFELLNVSTPTIGTLQLRTSTDAGVSFNSAAGNYAYGNRVLSTDSVDGTTAHTGTTSILLANSYNTISGTLSVYSPSSADQCQILFELSGEKSTNSKWSFYRGMGVCRADADVDAIRFFNSSGTITTGTIRLYGVI